MRGRPAAAHARRAKSGRTASAGICRCRSQPPKNAARRSTTCCCTVRGARQDDACLRHRQRARCRLRSTARPVIEKGRRPCRHPDQPQERDFIDEVPDAGDDRRDALSGDGRLRAGYHDWAGAGRSVKMPISRHARRRRPVGPADIAPRARFGTSTASTTTAIATSRKLCAVRRASSACR